MAYKTYFKFYRSTSFTVSPVKTDVCDFCTECENKLAVNPRLSAIYGLMSTKKVDKHKALKREYIKQANESDETLVLEFDYAQHLPLPKMNVTNQFFKRLLWLHVFNIHVHNDDTSSYYTFLEGQAKKV